MRIPFRTLQESGSDPQYFASCVSTKLPIHLFHTTTNYEAESGDSDPDYYFFKSMNIKKTVEQQTVNLFCTTLESTNNHQKNDRNIYIYN